MKFSQVYQLTDQFTYIIQRCQEGSQRAQKELYELFKAKMFGVCLRYSNNYEDAEDILQDGFLKVFEKIGQFAFRGAFEGWMRRIMVNTALERYKKESQVINIGDNIKDYEEISDAEIHSNMSAQELVKFVQELSPKYRLVFNMYAIEGYSHKEISNALDISEGTSKSNLSRARSILQDKVLRYNNENIKTGSKG